jgi:hypothetical protein
MLVLGDRQDFRLRQVAHGKAVFECDHEPLPFKASFIMILLVERLHLDLDQNPPGWRHLRTGIDVLLPVQPAGPTGKAYGLDMTDELLALARENQ